MAHAEGIEVINRSPADVFAFLANGENNSKWRSMVLETTHAPGTPEGLGAIYRQRTAGPVGWWMERDYEITEYEPGSRLAFQVVAGPARARGRYELEPTDRGTRVHFSLDWEPHGFARLFAHAVEREMPREIAMLPRLKYALEHAP
jgi:uncharacterized protein YndB with AHSA1/START domain